jgi:hypothetical protein
VDPERHSGDHRPAPDPASRRQFSPGAIFERFLHEHPWAGQPGGPAQVRKSLTREQFNLLVEKMYVRIEDDRDALTIAQANGVGMGMGGDEVYKRWLAGRQSQPEAVEPVDTPALRQRAAIMRLSAMYGQQANQGLRNAIRVKKN